ncbi:MAG: signal recognition particle-docking protein FtsY [Wolinella sp.]
MFSLLKKTLNKTIEGIEAIIPKRAQKIDKELLEEVLIASDMEYELVESLLKNLGNEVSRSELDVALHRFFRGDSYYDRLVPKTVEARPCVTLVLGVNGAGKTTTIAKLATLYKKQGDSVILGAGDTFRAAAIEQLKLWADRLELPIVYTQQGHDPSAVAYDTIASGIARKSDHIIIDTAGRLHNQTNLKNELLKIARTCDKALSGAPHQKLLIIDGTQGSSSIEQASIFHDTLGVDGIVITKLDGTSKGGALFSIINRLRVPILYIGVGEKADDLIVFNEDEYIKTLLDAIFI